MLFIGLFFLVFGLRRTLFRLLLAPLLILPLLPFFVLFNHLFLNLFFKLEFLLFLLLAKRLGFFVLLLLLSLLIPLPKFALLDHFLFPFRVFLHFCHSSGFFLSLFAETEFLLDFFCLFDFGVLLDLLLELILVLFLVVPKLVLLLLFLVLFPFLLFLEFCLLLPVLLHELLQFPISLLPLFLLFLLALLELQFLLFPLLYDSVLQLYSFFLIVFLFSGLGKVVFFAFAFLDIVFVGFRQY